MQQALPTAIVALLQQGQQGQQQWGGGYGQQSFGPPSPPPFGQQIPQPGFGFGQMGQMGQPFGIG